MPSSPPPQPLPPLPPLSRLACAAGAAGLLLAGCYAGVDHDSDGPMPTGASASASLGGGTSSTGDDPSGDPTATTGDPGSTTATSTTAGPTTTTSPTTTTTTTTTTDGVDDPCIELDNCGDSDGSGESGELPPDPCVGASDGLHCGAYLGGFADHTSLYQCMDGKTYSAAVCELGCENNLCKKPPENQDPCVGANSGNGDYCGETLPGGAAGHLYTCIDNATTASQPCPDGCQINPPGIADKCVFDEDLCQYANGGNGPYCGGSLKPGVADDDLFQCHNKMTQNQQTCAHGCIKKPPGEADLCAPGQGGGQCCVLKPPGILTQSYSACGHGGQHYGIDYGLGVGNPIYAGIGGTVVAMALGFPNCYNPQTKSCSQSCWNSFNYVKLKSACGDPSNPNNDLYIYYLHIDGVPNGIHKDAVVSQGDLLAYSGNSGCSSGPHIHIETVSVPKGQQAFLNTCNSKNPSGLYCP